MTAKDVVFCLTELHHLTGSSEGQDQSVGCELTPPCGGPRAREKTSSRTARTDYPLILVSAWNSRVFLCYLVACHAIPHLEALLIQGEISHGAKLR